jgi:hypothetical protein
MRTDQLAAAVAALTLASAARAATIEVGPSDSYQKIEAAQAGDEVVIAPGVYRYLVYLTGQGTVDRPIVIRAQDPANPPVWDLSSTPLDGAPGSYGAGDRGRGCWQIAGGSHYRISGIVFAGCRNASRNAAGLRYYAGSTGILLRDCVFRQNDNGLTGGTEQSELTVEFSEFDRNGNTQASAMTHNVYVYGGTFTLRYSYLHDPVQGQNFHIRSKAGTLEYNWIARGRSYEGDLMTDDDWDGSGTYSQSLLLRGNVLVQDAAPANHSQVVAVYNDAGAPGLTLDVRLVNNTFVGNGGHAALVHLSNADGTRMSAELSNNIVAGTTVPVLVETASAATVTGAANWLATSAATGGLAGSIQSVDPGFADPGGGDFTLAPGSAPIGKASQSVSGLPDREYDHDQPQARAYRTRASARDLGAFESTTSGAAVGPYGAPIEPPVTPPAGPPGSGGKVSGCGQAAPAGWTSALLLLVLLSQGALRRRRSSSGDRHARG